MVMKWLVPESSGRYVNRMTNEALHKGRDWALFLSYPGFEGMLDVPGCHRQSAIQLGAYSGYNHSWKREPVLGLSGFS